MGYESASSALWWSGVVTQPTWTLWIPTSGFCRFVLFFFWFFLSILCVSEVVRVVGTKMAASVSSLTHGNDPCVHFRCVFHQVWDINVVQEPGDQQAKTLPLTLS